MVRRKIGGSRTNKAALLAVTLSIATTTNSFVLLFADAWTTGGGLSSSPSPLLPPTRMTTRRGFTITTPRTRTATTSTVLRMSAVNETKVSSSSLPDFGKTTVEVDTIKLEKKRRKNEDYDTKVGMTNEKDNEKDNTNANDNGNKWRRSDLFGSSLVDQTMDELKNDKDFQTTQKRIKDLGLEGVSKEERIQRRRALDKLNVQPFARFLTEQMHDNKNNDGDNENQSKETTTKESSASTATATTKIKPYRLQRKAPTVLQINIGLYCNQACGHCHVESSPLRTEEMMTAQTAAQCLELLKNTPSVTTLDITGGAPELNQHFRYLVSTARAVRGKDLIIIDRCNLTVLQEPGQEDLVGFLREHDVHVVASLPCYSAENVDTQRGGGVFERSIAALLALNEVGYGRNREDNIGVDNDDDSPRLQLDLVYNPLGAFLPPPQENLQVQYQKQLAENFGILFDQLFTITNMPIKRFADFLHRRGELAEYMHLLVRNFNPDTVEQLMCLDTINIGWDGKVRAVLYRVVCIVLYCIALRCD